MYRDEKLLQKDKLPDFEAEENIMIKLEGIAQTFLKMEESRSQTMLKLEANWADLWTCNDKNEVGDAREDC